MTTISAASPQKHTDTQERGIVDVHHHIIPDIYRESLAEEGILYAGGKSIDKWDVQMSLDHMKHLGVQTAFVSISDPALIPLMERNPEKAKKLARRTNEFMAQMINDHPGRFGAFALLPMPDVEASIEELRYALDVLKLDGVGLLSNYGGQYLGDAAFDPLFEELQKRGAVIYLHPSAPPKDVRRPEFVSIDYMEEFTFNTTRAAANLVYSGTLSRCPDIKIILSHMGGAFPYLRWRLNHCFPGAREYAKKLPVEEHVKDGWASVSGSFNDYMTRFWFDTALNVDENVLNMVEDVAPGHTLFGSDSFYASQSDGQLFVRTLKEILSRKEYAAVAYKNAQRLFPEKLR